MEFQERRLRMRTCRRFVPVQRTAKIGAIAPCAPLNQLVVVAGETGDGALCDKEVRDCGVTGIGGTFEFNPRNEILNELRLERVQIDEILCQGLKILAKRGIDVRIHSNLVGIKAHLGNPARRGEIARRSHRQSCAAKNHKTTRVHGRQQSRSNIRSQCASPTDMRREREHGARCYSVPTNKYCCSSSDFLKTVGQR